MEVLSRSSGERSQMWVLIWEELKSRSVDPGPEYNTYGDFVTPDAEAGP